MTKVLYPTYSEELFYDKVGNRTKHVAKGIEALYSYDARNRLTTLTTGQGMDLKTTHFEYDAQGNLLKDDKSKYTYDGFNRTQKVETFDGRVQINRYDAEGLRHEIEENGQLVQFIFCGREVVVEKTENDTIRLIRGYDITASESERARTYYHYVSDEQGSTTHIFEGKELRNRYEYDAFGNLTTSEEQVANRFKYTGQQHDPITQQYYLRARFYNPVVARFTQEDPYRGAGLNLYAYCDNNPVIYFDPSGYSPCPTKQDLYNKYRAEGMTAADANYRASLDLIEAGYRQKGYTQDKNGRWHNTEGKYVDNAATAYAKDNPLTAKYINEQQNKQNTQSTHKNNKNSTAPNHVYVIVDTRTGELMKVGISGQPLLKNGESPRANSQISPSNTNSKMNQLGLLDTNDPNKYKAVVIEQNITRQQALDIEQQITDKHAARNEGNQPSDVHEKPTPRVDNIVDYMNLYGIQHNRPISSGGRY